MIAALDITNKEITKKDVLLGYQKGDIEVDFKAHQPFNNKTNDYHNWKQWFESYTLTGVYRRNLKERYGVQLEGNPQKDKFTATGLIEYKYADDSFTRLKFDNHLNLTLLIKKTLTEKLALSFGTLLPLKR